MTASPPRAMSFAVGRLAGSTGAGRWHWTVYSHPDRILLRGGTIAGDRAKAERAGRAAIASMGGTVLSTDGGEMDQRAHGSPATDRLRTRPGCS